MTNLDLIEDIRLYQTSRHPNTLQTILKKFHKLDNIQQILACNAIQSHALNMKCFKYWLNHPDQKPTDTMFMKFASETFEAASEAEARFIIDACIRMTEPGWQRKLYLDSEKWSKLFTEQLLAAVTQRAPGYTNWLLTIAMKCNQENALTRDVLQLLWDTQQARNDLVDFYMNYVHMTLEQKHEKYGALHQTITNYHEVEHIPVQNQGYYNGSHNVHQLDAIRNKYIASLLLHAGEIQPHEYQKASNFVQLLMQPAMFRIEEDSPKWTKLLVSHQTHVNGSVNNICDNLHKTYIFESMSVLNLLKLIMVLIERLEGELKEEAKHRLITELIAMKGTCISGHVNRLCTVLVGFVEITIFDAKAYVEKVFQKHFDDIPSNILEDILLNMMDGDYSEEEKQWISRCKHETLKECNDLQTEIINHVCHMFNLTKEQVNDLKNLELKELTTKVENE